MMRLQNDNNIQRKENTQKNVSFKRDIHTAQLHNIIEHKKTLNYCCKSLLKLAPLLKGFFTFGRITF